MKIAVITGASSGIGRELVFAVDREKDYDEIWVIARRRDRLEALAQELSVPLHILPLDLTREEDWAAYERELEEKKPGLVIMDLVLPRLDGLEVLRRMQDMKLSCRILVLSSFISEKVIDSCSQYGADYFMQKPCDTEAVAAHINSLFAPQENTMLQSYDCRSIAGREAALDAAAALYR